MMNQKINPYDYFDIDPTPVRFQDEKKKVTVIEHSPKHPYQLLNVTVYSGLDNKEIIEEASINRYIDMIWERCMHLTLLQTIGFLEHHRIRSKNKKEFWQLIKYSLIHSPIASFAGGYSRKGINQGIKQTYENIQWWVAMWYNKFSFEPIELWIGNMRQLEAVYNFLYRKAKPYTNHTWKEFHQMMTGRYIEGERLNFTNYAKYKILYLFDKLAYDEIHKERYINDDYLSEDNKIQPRILTQIITVNGEIQVAEKLRADRNDYKKKIKEGMEKSIFREEMKLMEKLKDLKEL